MQLGIADEDVRKGLLAVITGRGSAGGGGGSKTPGGGEATEARRKRGRDSDLDKPLPSRAPKGVPVDDDFEFDEIEAEEVRLLSRELVCAGAQR